MQRHSKSSTFVKVKTRDDGGASRGSPPAGCVVYKTGYQLPARGMVLFVCSPPAGCVVYKRRGISYLPASCDCAGAQLCVLDLLRAAAIHFFISSSHYGGTFQVCRLLAVMGRRTRCLPGHQLAELTIRRWVTWVCMWS